MFRLYSKIGCEGCDVAKSLLDSNQLNYEVFIVGDDALAVLYGPDKTPFFPYITYDERPVGSLSDLRVMLTEPILKPSTYERFIFESPYKWAIQFFDDAQSSFWITKEIRMMDDIREWSELDPDIKSFVKNILAFFFVADGVVGESIVDRYMQVQDPACRAFLGYQLYNEQVHSQTYAMMLKTLITDDRERVELLDVARNKEHIRCKTDWSLRWIKNTNTFAQKTVAFACVELIFFSSSFCSLFWLKRKGILQGLTFSNELISRDEGLHGDFACALYRNLTHQLPQDQAQDMVKDAVRQECFFVEHSLNVDMIGLKKDLMYKHVQYMGDRVLDQLGYEKVYNVETPYMDLCERQSLQGQTNFFERNVSEYQRGVMSVDEDFGDVGDLM